MAEDPHTYQPNTVQTNRARMQGNGVGQKEMDGQRDPNRDANATDPQRLEPFEEVPGEERAFDRDAAGQDQAGDLGAGTPPGVDIHDLGQQDRPEQEWGEAAGEGALHSATHSRRGVKTEAERGQGAKTRQANKDTVSRRG